MSQQLLDHRRQSMRSAALVNPSQAVKRAGDSARQRQVNLQKAISRWDGEGGAGPDGLQEGGKLLMPVSKRRAHEDVPLSVNPFNPVTGVST